MTAAPRLVLSVVAEPTVDPDAGWQRHGLCLGLDPELFFPGRGDDAAPAKAVCAECPVRATCLDHALANGEKFGVWGGKSEKERQKLRRTRPRERCCDVCATTFTSTGYAIICSDECRAERRRQVNRRHMERARGTA